MRKEITEDQIAQLLAGIPRAEEVDRLKAEVARLTRERDEARAEVERLRGTIRQVALAALLIGIGYGLWRLL